MGYGRVTDEEGSPIADPSLIGWITGTPALTSSANSAMLSTAGQPSTITNNSLHQPWRQRLKQLLTTVHSPLSS